ncbi:MAG: FAD-linked oxidase C-terminal domain-containing protein [Alloacidobacterium sp.]
MFHAGDGNLHPLVLYDRRIEGQEQAAEILAQPYSRTVHRGWWLHHWRARCGRRKENDDVQDVCGARP